MLENIFRMDGSIVLKKPQRIIYFTFKIVGDSNLQGQDRIFDFSSIITNKNFWKNRIRSREIDSRIFNYTHHLFLGIKFKKFFEFIFYIRMNKQYRVKMRRYFDPFLLL